ncbi:cytochrome C [Pseudooceanicola sediminis]|uniref:Cytochrome C n=2 Tax=Pseudooceanicola sediminis TaxID=2211117 RepID=A0A399IX92_9RHOB|nr:cytochrome C [Puniceibacterium sp. HSS470]RII37775.1 cytochrome C [Pseudooceanicola sediminis]|tara:strand:- start:71117 stop:71527 length:411 start_codon:yes stop_codon:yes gene_type:complete
MMTATALLCLATPALADMGDAAVGEKEFRKCKSCHQIASADEVIVKGGRTGPNLYGIIGRQAGIEDFRYGADLVTAGEQGLVWNADTLQAYITDPRGFLRETLGDDKAQVKMTFRLRDHQADVAAYLAQFGQDSGS